MKRNFVYLSIFALFTLASCVVKPYSSPDVESEMGLTGYNKVEVDTATMAAMSWKSIYNDVYLEQYVSEALDSNFNVRIALSQIDQATAYLKQSKWALAPTLSASATAGYSNPTDVGSTPVASSYRAESYQLSINASWEIDIWGKLSSAKRAAYANILSQEASKDAIVTQLISEMASAYYQLMSLDYKLTVINETVDNYQAYLETVKSLKESAQTNEVAVQQAEAQLYGAQSLVPQIESAIVVLENYICFLMGSPGKDIYRTRLDNLEVAPLRSIEAGVPAQLLQYRPDVRLSESQLRASWEQFNMAKASMYPALTLGGSVGSESADISDWFAMPTSLFWNTVASLVQPIFAGRQLRTAKEVAKMSNDQALLSFKATVLNAAQEVSNAFATTKSSAESHNLQSKQAVSLRKACDYSEQLMVQGYATYLDVLVAQSALFTTELNLCSSYLDVMQQRIELYRALGGGWR